MADESVFDVNASGIYQIRNIANGKRYVGSALRISKRWKEHLRDLRKDAHHSKALQRAWNKYGIDVFSFEVVENCSTLELILREQFYLDEKSEYNICKIAGSSLGRKASAETREKIRIAQAKIRSAPGWISPTAGRKYSREICERMAAPKRGRKRPPRSEEWRQRLSDSRRGKQTSAGRKLSATTKEKIRASLTGRRLSIDERKANRKLSLSDEKVLRLLHLRISGLGYKQIEKQTGVRAELVRRICIRKRYPWVAPEIVVPKFRRLGWEVKNRKSRSMKNGNKQQGVFDF